MKKNNPNDFPSGETRTDKEQPICKTTVLAIVEDHIKKLDEEDAKLLTETEVMERDNIDSCFDNVIHNSNQRAKITHTVTILQQLYREIKQH